MKKITDNAISFVVGGIVSMITCLLVLQQVNKPNELNYDSGYKDGYRQASKECLSIIKNTK